MLAHILIGKCKGGPPYLFIGDPYLLVHMYIYTYIYIYINLELYLASCQREDKERL